MLDHLDARAVRRWGALAQRRIAVRRASIDGLNVFPVPDGDTGTNLHLTLSAAVRQAETLADDASLTQVSAAFAHGALLGARGSSGVILSQLLAGWAQALADRPDGGPDAVRDALRRAAEGAAAAVSRPVEGTIVSVARAAAEGAQAGRSLADVVAGAVSGARTALAGTTDQLDVLRVAGVVDAGAQGLVELLDALEQVVLGRSSGAPRPAGDRAHPRPAVSHENAVRPEDTHDPADLVEVMLLLDLAAGAPAHAMPDLRAELERLGEAVVVVGDAAGRTHHVHVHTADVGAVLEAALLAGRPHRVRVTRLDDVRPALERPLRVLVLASGPGTRRAAAASGAELVDLAGVVAALSTASANGDLVVLLVDPVLAARAGAELAGTEPAGGSVVGGSSVGGSSAAGSVVGGSSVGGSSAGGDAVVLVADGAQTLAALAVHDPVAPSSRSLARLTRAVAATRTAPVRPGHDPGLAVDALLAVGGELVTLLVGGAEGAAAAAEVVRADLAGRRPDVEVAVVDGGEPGLLLTVGVE